MEEDIAFLQGGAYVVYGGQGGTIDLTRFPNAQGFVIIGPTDDSYPYPTAGSSVSGTGDVNRDGIPDLLIGAPGAGASYYEAGNAYLVYGGQSGTIDLTHFPNAQGFIITGGISFMGDRAGSSVSGTGDVNGDSIPDLLIGAPLANPENDGYGGPYPGEAYVVYGGQSGTINLTYFPNVQGFVIKGTMHSDEMAGSSVSGIGDINGDGIPDLLIGAPGGGRVYVVYGGQHGTIDLTYFPNRQGFVIEGIDYFGKGDAAGTSVSGTGDLNGDGIPDMLIGTPNGLPCKDKYGEISCRGAAYVVYGGQSGTIDLMTLSHHQGFMIKGAQCGDELGTVVSGLGDINRDGYDDIIVGALGWFDQLISYVIYGGQNKTIYLSTFPSPQGFLIDNTAYVDGSCIAVSGLGDINRDAIPDIAVSTFYNSNNGAQKSTNLSYLVYGRPQPTSDIIANSRTNEDQPNESNVPVQEATPNEILNFYSLAGQQFNMFYQQAKEYLASFWRASWYNSTENKERALSPQEERRLERLEDVQATLDKLELTLKTDTHDNKAYLTKVVTFYQKMVTKWQENVVDISAKDIRALQADIAIIKEAVYLAPLAELGIPIAPRRSTADNSFGLFALVNTSFAASQNALLAAQPLRALP